MKENNYSAWRCYLLLLLQLAFGVGEALLFWPMLMESRWWLLLYIAVLAAATCPLRAAASVLLNRVALHRGDPIPYPTWKEKLLSEFHLL